MPNSPQTDRQVTICREALEAALEGPLPIMLAAWLNGFRQMLDWYPWEDASEEEPDYPGL